MIDIYSLDKESKAEGRCPHSHLLVAELGSDCLEKQWTVHPQEGPTTHHGMSVLWCVHIKNPSRGGWKGNPFSLLYCRLVWKNSGVTAPRWDYHRIFRYHLGKMDEKKPCWTSPSVTIVLKFWMQMFSEYITCVSPALVLNHVIFLTFIYLFILLC
jgi:hypothetical protein